MVTPVDGNGMKKYKYLFNATEELTSVPMVNSAIMELANNVMSVIHFHMNQHELGHSPTADEPPLVEFRLNIFEPLLPTKATNTRGRGI